MSCYNGFDVYRRDENGRLFYEEELSDYVCGRKEANEIWQIGWSRTYASQGTPEKQIIFNKEFNGKNMAYVFGPSDYFDRTKVTYEYRSVEDFTKEVLDAAEPYRRDHEKVADRMRNEIRAKSDYILNLYKRQAAIKADDDKTFKRAFDAYEEHIKKALATLAESKIKLEQWNSDDLEGGDENMIRVHQIEQMLKKLKAVHEAHPDYVIVQFCED